MNQHQEPKPAGHNRCHGAHGTAADQAGNDAPALAAVGIAMGTGTDVAMSSAQVTLVKGDLLGILRSRDVSVAAVNNMREVRQIAPSVRATGLVRSRSAADLAAAVAGRLEFVAEPGTAVKSGELVARLDSRETSLARAELAQTQDLLNRSRLTAPFDGVVADRVRRQGEEVARGEVIARIVNPDELEIRLFVPLRHVRAIRPGHVVEVVSERRKFTAAVSATVQVRLPLGEPQRRLSVPRDALIIRAEGLYVVKVDREQRAERVPVKAGVADGDWIAIDGTLQAGDRIVVRGGETLRGKEKLDIVGVFEDAVRSATTGGGQPAA